MTTDMTCDCCDDDEAPDDLTLAKAAVDDFPAERDRLAAVICAARHYPIRELSDSELATALIARGVRAPAA